jgi:hypothetical protein
MAAAIFGARESLERRDLGRRITERFEDAGGGWRIGSKVGTGGSSVIAHRNGQHVNHTKKDMCRNESIGQRKNI